MYFPVIIPFSKATKNLAQPFVGVAITTKFISEYATSASNVATRSKVLIPDASSARYFSINIALHSHHKSSLLRLFPSLSLHRPVSPQHNPHSLKQNLNIQPHPPLSYILFIQLHDLFKIRNLTSPANLPHTCNSWFYAQPDPMA